MSVTKVQVAKPISIVPSNAIKEPNRDRDFFKQQRVILQELVLALISQINRRFPAHRDLIVAFGFLGNGGRIQNQAVHSLQQA